MKILSCLLVLTRLLALGLSTNLSEKISRINENDKITFEIAHCTEIVAKVLFDPRNDISIVASNSSNYPELVRKILLKSSEDKIVRISTNLVDMNHEMYINERAMSIIIIDERANVREIMENRMTVEGWAEYIVVTKASFKWFQVFSRLLWYRGYVKVAFIGVNTNKTSSVFALVQDSKGSTPYLKRYDICENVSLSRTTRESKKNHREKSTNLISFSSWAYIPKNSTLTYSRINMLVNAADRRTSPDSKIANNATLGIDGIKIFAAKHHFDLWERVWDKQNETTWEEAMERCVKSQFDFFYTGHLVPENSNYEDHVRAVAWYKFESLIFFDTVKTIALPMKSFLAPFETSVWLCSFGVSVFFFLFAWMTVKLSRRGLLHERITILELWAISVNQSLLSTPTKFGLRFVIGMWLVRTLIFNGSYTSAFSTSLIAHTHDYRLKTFEDILNSKRSICGSEKIRELLKHDKDPVIRKIHDGLKVMHSRNIFDAVINKSYIGSHRLSDVERRNWQNRGHYLKQFYTFNDAIITRYPVFYYAKKRHPFNDEFDRIIGIARDSGIMEKLSEKYIGEFDERQVPNYPFLPAEKQVLNMTHLRAAFELLLVGHLISGIVLIIEIIVHKISMKQQIGTM